MKEETIVEKVFAGEGQPEPTEPADSEGQPDIKIVKKPRNKKEDYSLKKEARKRKRLSGDVENLLKTMLGQDVFEREEQTVRLAEEKEDNNKNMKEKTTETPAGRTMQEQLAAKKDEIEKVIVSGSQELSTAVSLGGEQKTEGAEKTEEISGDNLSGRESDKENPGQTTGDKLEQELKAAFKKTKNPRHEYELAQPIRDEIFRDIQQKNPKWGPGKVREEVVKIIEKTEGQIKREEKEKKEKIEDLKKQLEERYKVFYEDYINKDKEAPKELCEALEKIKNELRGLVRLRIEVSDLTEQIKEKYKEDKRGEEEKIKKGKKMRPEVQEAKKIEGAEGPAKKLGYTKEMVEARAAEIERRRIEGKEAGFTWQEIDALLRKNKIEPGTPEAKTFMAEWDKQIARQELAKENKQEKTIKTVERLGSEEQKRESLRIITKKETSEQKAELPPEKMDIFKKFGQRFYDILKEEASWEGYNEENKRLTLEIQTKVFLTNQLKKINLVGEDKSDEIIGILIEAIKK